MQYALLIYEAEGLDGKRSEAERNAIYQAYGVFTQDIMKSGHMKAGEALQPTSTATTVRVNKDGKVVTTDGPFAETREQFGGYYIIEAKNLDEAVAIAGRLPSAKSGSIEVRPVMKIEM